MWIMLKFKKDFNVRIISLVIAVLFIFNSAVYGIPAKSCLRIPVGETDTYKRLTEAIETREEQKKDPHDTYRELLKKILREAEDTLAYFYTRSDVPEAKAMARDFAENALVSIIRRETESNFTIPHLPEGFPTLSQLMDSIADKSSSEQEIFLNKYIRQIVGALLFLEIPAYLRKQWSQNAGAGQEFPLLGDGGTTIVGAMSQSNLQREYEELNRELLKLGEERTQIAETYKNQPLIKRMKLAEIEKQLEAIRVRMREIDDQLRPLKGGMHDSAKRFKALQRFLKIYNIDMGTWIDEQASKMSEQDRVSITDALTKIGLGDSQIKPLLSAIILCEIPENIRLEGKGRFASRIGGLIVKTKDGYRILFPKGRLSKDLNNKEYLGDLLHEVEELNLIESGMQVDKAHEQAMAVRSSFLNGEPIRLTNATALFKPQAAELSTAKTAIAQSLDKVILFNGEEVTDKLGSFSEIYTTKNKDNIFVVVVEDAPQKETLERELRGVGLIPDSDDLKVKVLRGPALEDYKAMLDAGEILGDFTIIRGRNIDETRTSLRDTLASI